MSRPASAPTRARLFVLLFLCTLMFVLYLDRICIAKAVGAIKDELHLSHTEMSCVLMAFTLAYGLFEVPTGHWGDRIGARKVLTRIAVWWSLFTMLTGLCFGFWPLLVVRFLFGAGEAGALPNAARVIARWFPAREQGTVQGLLQTTALLGGAVAPVVAAYLIEAVGWRGTFLFFGVPGVAWALLFWAWFRDNPARHPGVNDAEREAIGTESSPPTHAAIPWAAVLRNPSVWLLGFVITCSAFNTYLYFSWFPTYLEEGRSVKKVEAGWLASLVLAGGALGTLSGGFLNDLLGRHQFERVRARRVWGVAAFVLSAAFLTAGILSESPRATATFAALSCLSTTSTLSMWWSCASEVSGRHVGALFGLMNGMGVVGAMASQFFVGACADWRKGLGYAGREQWDPALWAYVAVLLVAAAGWSLLTLRVVEQEQGVQHDSGPVQPRG